MNHFWKMENKKKDSIFEAIGIHCNSEGPDRKTSTPRKRVQEVEMGAERAGGMPRGWPGTESPGQPAPGETQAGDDVEIARDTFDVLGFRLLVKGLGWNSYSVLRQCSR